MTPAEAPGEHPARLRVGVVGAGRVGSVLGAALNAAGHRVCAASGLSQASLDRARTLLPGVPIYDVEDVVERAELLLLTVPEADLPELVRGLSVRRVWQPGQIVIHTSARHGVDLLEPAAARHVLPIALHPAMRFTGTALDLDRLTQSCVAVTSAEPLRAVGEALVIEMGAEPVWVQERHRAQYAAAVAHLLDHVAVALAQSTELLEAADVDQASRLLDGLLSSGIDTVLRGDGADAAQHIVGDLDALSADLRSLTQATPDIRAVHLAVARAAAARAMSAGRLRHIDADRLFDVLTDRDASAGPPDSLDS